MAQSVKLSDEVMALVRRESQLQSRSVAGQITHWLRIGRAIEQSGTFDYARIRSALEGKLSPEALTEEEHEVWLADFAESFAEPSEHSKTFFAERKSQGLGVGLDRDGTIRREKKPK